MQSILFDTDDSLLRVVGSVPFIYLAVVAFIRLSGKRTTSKMNSFDWIVTVAIGSLVAAGVILEDTHIVEVLVAIAMLIGLQYLLTIGIVKSATFETIVKNGPVLLLYDSQMLKQAMDHERISEREILAAVRSSGASTIKAVRAIVLENDATLSVLLHADADDEDMSAFHDVKGWPGHRNTR